MLKIAVVDDSQKDADTLRECLTRYGRENNIEIKVEIFTSGVVFLTQYREGCDIVFLDIDMPGLNGLTVGKCLREIDTKVMLVYVTALARFAVNGYEVNAFDFIVKPVQYPAFSAKMTRMTRALSKLSKRTKLLIKSGEKNFVVYEDEIVFAEIFNHMLSFHTLNGVIETRGTMKDISETLTGTSFAMCNKSCIVNLQYVEMIDGNDVVMQSGERHAISRPRKTEFMQQIADYFVGRKVNTGRF